MTQEPSLLLTARETASLIGFSLRMLHYLRKQEHFPKPIILGPRAVRWRRRDIEAWVDGLAANNDFLPEPLQLLQARRMRARPPSPFEALGLGKV